MLQFFETRMGKHFYEGQVPKLINSIEKLANAVEAANRKLDVKQEAPAQAKMTIDLGSGVMLKVEKKGAKGDYPGFLIEIVAGGTSYPLATIEELQKLDSDESIFHVVAWDDARKDEPSHIIKSKYTFSDVVSGALDLID